MPRTGLLLALSFVLFTSAALAAPTSVTCLVSAVPTPVRAEGLTEIMGDIALNCSGGQPGGTLHDLLYVYLTVPITNRVSSTGGVDAVLLVDTGSGLVPSGVVPSLATNGIAFIINTQVPLSGAVSFRIRNVRGAVAQQGVTSTAPIMANLGVSGGLHLNQAAVTVGIPTRALFASTTAATITCYGSPVPETISMSGLISAGTRSSTMRIARGFAAGFGKRQPGADTGTRIVLTYAGFPAAARLFLPDVVAGSDASLPTGSGNLMAGASGGAYTPSAAGSLLLSRVNGADATGAGGVPVFTPGAVGSGTVLLDGASEVTLVGGAARVVYEVMDTNPDVVIRESAEIPTFISYPQGGPTGSSGRETISLGPVSTVATATEADPIPRFVAADVPSDCTVLGDCASFPKLVLDAPSLTFTADYASADQGKWIGVMNGGGGTLAWDASLQFTTGSGWATIHIDPWGAIFLRVSPKSLAPGVYEASLTVDAGAYAGKSTLPIKLTIAMPAVKIDSVSHAATYVAGPVAPGSIAMLKGSGLTGNVVAVSFDGMPAKVLYKSATQINLVVPAGLGSRTTAQVIVIADGVSSVPFTAQLTAVNPGVFPNGVLNQDMSVNSAANGASAGTVAVIFATGLPATGISVKLAGREITTLDYAGPAPTLDGVEQINVRIPPDLAPQTASLQVCAEQVCSPAVNLTIR